VCGEAGPSSVLATTDCQILLIRAGRESNPRRSPVFTSFEVNPPPRISCRDFVPGSCGHGVPQEMEQTQKSRRPK